MSPGGRTVRSGSLRSFSWTLGVVWFVPGRPGGSSGSFVFAGFIGVSSGSFSNAWCSGVGAGIIGGLVHLGGPWGSSGSVGVVRYIGMRTGFRRIG